MLETMFRKVFCVRILLVYCLFNTVSQSSEHTILRQSSNPEFERCEDVSVFLNTLYSLPPDKAFQIIISPLGCNNCPIEIKSIRNKLTTLAVSAILDVRSLLINLKNIGHLNRNDVLISTLMAIIEMPNIDSAVKADISDTIFYLLKKRYLGRSHFGTARNGFFEYRSFPRRSNKVFSQSPQNFAPSKQRPNIMVINSGLQPDVRPSMKFPNYPYYSIPNPLRKLIANVPSVCQLSTIELLLKKVIDLEVQRRLTQQERNNRNRIPQGLVQPGTQQGSRQGLSNNGLIPGSNVARSNNPSLGNYNAQACVKPKQISPKLIPFQFGRPSPLNNFGNFVPQLQKPLIQPRNFGPKDDARDKATNLRLQNLINLVPVPTYPKEKQMYEQFKTLLASPQVQELAKNMNITDKQTDQEILDVIITTVLETVDIESIHEVFEFYNNYREAGQSKFNYALLIYALPQPQNPKEQEFYNIMKAFLTGKDVYHIAQSDNFKNITNLNEKLIILLEGLIQASLSLAPELQQAIAYYLPILKGKAANIQFANILSLLPTPTNEAEANMYKMLKNTLSSNDLYVLLQNVDLKSLTPDQLLPIIIKFLIAQPQNKAISDAATYYRDLLAIKKYGFPYFNLLQLLPTQENATSVETLRNYFFTPEFERILAKLPLGSFSDVDKLLHILEAVKAGSTDATVVQAATIFHHNLQLQLFYDKMKTVINLIPLPTTEKEVSVYGILKSFLLSEAAYNLLNHIDLNIFPDNKVLLEFIMKAVLESTLHPSIKHAFEYYVDLTERLEALEFVTKKEIRKNFKLTEIFTDTLDLKSLTYPQKDAFRAFFKYISQIKREEISNFDSWDQANTRGEFMKLLFEYLMKRPTTPAEIKESIQVLDSLVHMDGKGALPP